MHNIQPRGGDNIKDFTAINTWYQRLEERYNFSLERHTLPLMTTDSLAHLAALDPPFMHKYKGTYDENNSVSIIIGMNQSICYMISDSYFQARTQHTQTTHPICPPFLALHSSHSVLTRQISTFQGNLLLSKEPTFLSAPPLSPQPLRVSSVTS